MAANDFSRCLSLLSEQISHSRPDSVSTATGEARSSIDLKRGLSTALAFGVASHRRAEALLATFSLLVFLPGFFQIPPADRDAARFAQATKQMLETSEYVDIRFQTEVRYKT